METKKYSPEHLRKYVSREIFDDLRCKKQLFDFKIIAGDKEFEVHKVLLAIESDYFRAMLTHNSKELQEGKVTLRDIDSGAIESILEFCYTGEIRLSEENIENILLGSSMLQIQKIQNICASYIEEHLDCTNCLGVFVLAERFHLKNLAATALSYCLCNFREVANEQEFTDLDISVLKRLLSDDILNVDDESEVMEAIKKWIDADPDGRTNFLLDLMKLIRFPHIDPVYLARLNSYEPIRNCKGCMDLVNLAKNYFLLKNYPEEQALVKSQLNTTDRVSFKKQRLYAVGGWTDQFRSIATAEVYNPNKDCWDSITPMTQKRCGVGLVTLGDSIYAVGGHDGINYLNSVERYDISREVWFRDVADMKYVRTSVGVATLDGYIYAIGGQVNNGATDKVEKYDPSSNKWTVCAPLMNRRLGAGVATCKGHIYVMGGSDGYIIFDSVERYDSKTDTWTYVAHMGSPRKHLGSCCCAGKIYAVGGRSNGGELAGAEVYEPNTDTWRAVKPMEHSRCGIGLVELAGRVYAVGGSNQDIRLDLVEAYNPETNLWTTRAPMKACRLGGGMAVHPVA